MKCYFNKVDDCTFCYSLNHFKELRESMDSDIILIEAEVSFGDGTYYCTEFGEVGLSGEGCGSDCKKYQPRNGKNGRCRFSKNTYVETDKEFKLTEDNKLVQL